MSVAMLVDGPWYRRFYPDIAAAGVDPVRHYLTQGWREGRLPMAEPELLRRSGLFDDNYYLINGSDLFDAGVDPLAHFVCQGWTENRNPNPYFDVAWYCRLYPDRLHRNPLTDYVLGGEASGRTPGQMFDPVWYRAAYALPAGSSPLRHWLEHRRTQRYSPLREFDVAAYVAANPTGLRANRDPFMHALAVAAFTSTRPPLPGSMPSKTSSASSSDGASDAACSPPAPTPRTPSEATFASTTAIPNHSSGPGQPNASSPSIHQLTRGGPSARWVEGVGER